MNEKLTNSEVLSLLKRFETEWTQFRGMWDQLMPSFQHMGIVVARYREISTEIPRLETQHAELITNISGLKKDLATGKAAIEAQLVNHRNNMEKELAPLTKELNDTRERVVAIQGARADAERSFEERRTAQEITLRELEDRLVDTRRKLSEISLAAAGAIHE